MKNTMKTPYLTGFVIGILAFFPLWRAQGQTNDLPQGESETEVSEAERSRANEPQFLISLLGIASGSVATGKGVDNFGLGGGLLGEYKVTNYFGVESGLIFNRGHYERDYGSAKIVQEVNRIYLPVLARLWVTDKFSLGAGPYLGFRVGDTTTKLKVNDQVVTTLRTTADDNIEAGLDLAATYNFELTQSSNIFIEGRFTAILTNDADEFADQIAGLFGVKFEI